MPSNVRYRILLSHEDGTWVPCGVAYARRGQIVLFADWLREPHPLRGNSLERLGAADIPLKGEFRWREKVEVHAGQIAHPIDLLVPGLASSKRPTRLRIRKFVISGMIAAALLLAVGLVGWISPISGLISRSVNPGDAFEVSCSLISGREKNDLPGKAELAVETNRDPQVHRHLLVSANQPAWVSAVRVNTKGIHQLAGGKWHEIEKMEHFRIALEPPERRVDQEWFVALFVPRSRPAPVQDTLQHEFHKLLEKHLPSIVKIDKQPDQMQFVKMLTDELSQRTQAKNVRVEMCRWKVLD
jgi:hypothetical protein